MRRGYKCLAAALAVILLLAASRVLYVEEQGNFHAITAGEAYRSAQLDRGELEYYIRKYGIRSIINLRGEHPDKSWYRDEIEISTELGVMHYDFPLSASNEPGPDMVRKLIATFRNAPRPVLIHCMGGADRSGLAAAIWKVVIDNEPKAKAEEQLSILYGHLPVGKTTAMDRFFRKWAGDQGLSRNP